MATRRKTLLIVLLAIAAVVVVFNRPEPEADYTQPDRTTAAETGSDEEVTPEAETESQTIVRGITRTESTARTTTNTLSHEKVSPFPLSEDVSLPRWMDGFSERVRNSTVEDFELKRDQAEALDGEAAYWLHEFYKYCDDQPRADWQLDNVLSRVENRIENEIENYARERRLNRAQHTLDRYEQGYQLCAFLGPDFDAKLASLTWLETAANLGHMGAMRLYHSQARQLLTEDDSNLGFQQPDLIHVFKSNARRYARQLLETGHPQGYLLMARMYFMGDIYERDFKLAYAYAHAGYIAGTDGSQRDAQMWKSMIAVNLPPTDIPDAEKIARELLNPN